MNERPKMLLIDDDHDLLRLMTIVIGRAFVGRVDLTVMDDSVAAKNWIEKNSPNLVVTDFQMPCIDGFEILQCVRRQNTSACVIIHPGYVSADAIRREHSP